MTDDIKPFTGVISDDWMSNRYYDLSDPDVRRKLMDEATTRRVTPAELEENFALRDEIKQLRILVAAIIRDHGGRMYVGDFAFQGIGPRDKFTTEREDINERIVLTFKGEP